jgi:cyclic nucleotide-binding protein
MMRIESSVTSVSWIPSEAVAGLPKAAFTIGAFHYDEPPPDLIDDLEELYAAERFRFANRLAAWIEVEAGRVVNAGYSGRGYITQTRVRLVPKTGVRFQPAAFPELKASPDLSGSNARFVQTTGGRPGMPFPRPAGRRPFIQWTPPTVWTTLALTIGADGSSEHEMVGASLFPRHWIYDSQGHLVAKSGLTASVEWSRTSFGDHTPWGSENSQPLITVAESALERQLSHIIMRGAARPAVHHFAKGHTLAEQGQPGDELYLLLDGILGVFVDGQELAQVGPGAVMGERAVLEHGLRTATLRALTRCTVATAAADDVDREALERLAELHRREEET